MELELRETKHRAQTESLKIQILREAETKVGKFFCFCFLRIFRQRFVRLDRSTVRRTTFETCSN